jgi:integrase
LSLKVRPFRGRFEVDVHLRFPNGSKLRERRVAPVSSKTAALRWGRALELELVANGTKKVEAPRAPTLAQFAPRFIENYAKANRLKPSGVATKQSHLRTHLIPAFGKKRLDEIGSEEIAFLKRRLSNSAPATVNNTLSTLSKLLKVAVEWGVIEKMPCTIKLLHRPHVEMRFHDFHQYERLVKAAAEIDRQTYVAVLLGGEAGLRCGEMMALEWTDIDFERKRLRVARSLWKGHVTEPKSGRPRYVPMTSRLAEALAAHRHLRSKRVLCRPTGKALIQQEVQRLVRRAERLANLDHLGVHALRHTFCSHLAMRGAPAKAIQELAGHSELITTQRYMHFSPAALESAIRLLEKSDTHPQAVVGQVERPVQTTDDGEGRLSMAM